MKKLTEKPNNSETGKVSTSKRGALGRKPSTGRQRIPASRGAVRLRKSVNSLVVEESDRIATALIDEGIAGNMAGARILVELAGADQPPAQAKKSAAA